MIIWSAQDLLPFMLAGPAPVDFSVYGEQCVLVLDLASVQGMEQAAALAEWLPSLACPVIGLRRADLSQCRHPDESVCAPACDVVVESEADANLLCERIAANPIAAASFVELLRVTQDLSIAAGLSIESSVYATLQGGAEYARWLEKHRVTDPVVLLDEGEPVLQQREGHKLSLTLNRPSNLNAMSVEIRDSLVEAFRLVLMDDSITELHLYGRGRSFSTGGDLSEFGTLPDSASGHLIRMLSVPGKFLAAVASRLSGRATVAHVHGACVGSGIEFPAFAGHILADEKTWFQLPEIGMGLIPGAGGCISMAHRMGRQRLAWMALSGKRIRAQQALAWGLVDELE